MGFTYTGPNIDYTIDEYCCADAFGLKAGFEMDWGLGVRLPMDVAITSTDPMLEGSAYWPTSRAHGLDWSAEQFEQAGVVPEAGNEFVLRFNSFAGLKVTALWIDGVDLSRSLDTDGSSSFTTPLGAGSALPLSPLNVPILEMDAGVA